MGKIVKVRLTEYYPFQAGLSKKQKQIEGGVLDRMGKPLYSLEDYFEGKAPYVSLACDLLGGPPGNVREFRKYGQEAYLPELSMDILSYLDPEFAMVRMISFRLVDTGGNFYGDNKQVKVVGYEPIDVCRRAKPSLKQSFSGMLTEMWLTPS
jgi:hypothetical protein